MMRGYLGSYPRQPALQRVPQRGQVGCGLLLPLSGLLLPVAAAVAEQTHLHSQGILRPFPGLRGARAAALPPTEILGEALI